jgi:hypothetical protein
MPLEIPAYMLPGLIEETARELLDEGFTCTCPAAEQNGAGTIVLCGIERQPILVRRSPLSVKMWCAGDHTECPTWRDHRDGGEVEQRVKAAEVDHENAVATDLQIRSGLRVDDKGIEDRDLVDEHIRAATGEGADVEPEDGVRRGITKGEAAEIRRELGKGSDGR